ncbi:MAG: InlB B-repeat-containing protein, partial [Candidatus Freyarchaeota archaeon]
MYKLGRRAAASVVAFLVAVILLSSMSAGIMLLSEQYRRSTTSSVEPVEEVSEALREKLEVTLIGLSGGTATLQVDNIGDISVRVTRVLLKDDEGSLVSVSLSDPVEVPVGGSETITVDLQAALASGSGDYSHVAVMTERGNIFTAPLSTVIFKETGLPSGTEWSVTFNGETKSSTSDTIIFENVEPGTYSWSASSPPASGGVRYIASPSSGTITVPEQTLVEITYVTQYYLSMEVSPPGAGSVSPSSGWYNEGETVQISAVPNPGYRFDSWQGSGPGSYTGGDNPATIRMLGPITETAVFVKQGTVTFTASSLGSDASGTVLVIDGVDYDYSDLPISFTWDVGSTHSFEWKSPVSAGADKRYMWASTSGLSNERSGSITVPDDGGTVSAAYEAQYRWTFSQSGVGSDAEDPVVRIDGADCYQSDLPKEFWWSEGSRHSYQYYEYVYTSIDGKRYACHSPPSASFTVSSSGSVSASYHIEYGLTVQAGGGGTTDPEPGEYWYDSGASVSVEAIPNSGYEFDCWLLDGAKNTGNPISVSMNGPHTLKAYFEEKFGFSISASPNTLSICRGASKRTTITVTLVSGSPQSVSLSASSSPGGLQLSFNPSAVTPTSQSKLTISVPNSASPGTYAVTVTASGGGVTKTTTITVYVNVFSISVSPSSETVERPLSGSVTKTATVSITSGRGSGSSMTVTLSASGVPLGVTVSFSPSKVTVNPGSTATSRMTVRVSSSASAGTYTITITGSSD